MRWGLSGLFLVRSFALVLLRLPFGQRRVICGLRGGILRHNFVPALRDGREGGFSRRRFRARPGFRRCAAPGGVNQAHGDIEVLVQLAAEEIGHGGEVRHRLGAARDPLVIRRAVFLGRFGGLSRDIEKAQVRILRFGDLLFGVSRVRHRPLHVGLTRSHPDLADEDVLEEERLGVMGHAQVVDLAVGLLRLQRGLPFAVRAHDHFLHIGDGLLIHFRAEGDCQRRARIALAPHGVRLLLLQHHVAAENARHPQLRLGTGAQHGRQGRPNKGSTKYPHVASSFLAEIHCQTKGDQRNRIRRVVKTSRADSA